MPGEKKACARSADVQDSQVTAISFIGKNVQTLLMSPVGIILTTLAVTVTNMDKEYIKQHIKDLEEDVADCEKSVKNAELDLKDAQEWLNKMKVHYANAIIALNNYKLEHQRD
jgi:F0F1-type ATP synthase membrane subunit b/b'